MDPAINKHLNERGLLIRIYADKVRFLPGTSTLPRPYKKILDKFVGGDNDYIDVRLQYLTDVTMIKTITEYYTVVCSSGVT